MHFSHDPAIWTTHPELVAGVLFARGIRAEAVADAAIARYEALARQRLEAAGSESDLPEVQAWRRAFARMGLKPTQYRCAAEALLRRFRKEGSLPRIHPLVDLCNAISLAFAVPIAVFDAARLSGDLQVRRAKGDEVYESFSGEVEHPETPGRAPNLPLAKQTIDILGMLEQKTRGNLTAEERQLLEQVLYELRMRFVEATTSSGEKRLIVEP